MFYLIFFLLQLEDSQFSTSAAVKVKKGLEDEVADLQQQLDIMSKAKQDVSIYSTIIYKCICNTINEADV